MCGFVGQVVLDGGPVDQARISAMTWDLLHRGPDDVGYAFDEWVGLGFRRLSILDPSPAGHQPMTSPDGALVLVYNGELYNFQELRGELAGDGVSFASTGDTEVVLNSYLRWGRECLARFVGMFALAIADRRTGQVLLARDQLGIKPLYWTRVGGSLLFASEIKAFRHFIDFELNESALAEQVLFRYVPGQRTIFKGVHRLDPGTWMEVRRDGQIREGSYYDLTERIRAAERAPLRLDEVERELERSIERHTLSDVGYNMQLSGGLDSSYVTAVLASRLGKTPATFSVSLEGDLDESPWQRIVVDKFGTRHTTLELGNQDLATAYPRATWHMDIPIIHTACPFLMLLCDRSREDSKVVLTGEGADELFCGYSRFLVSPAQRAAHALRRMGIAGSWLPDGGRLGSLKRLLASDPGVDAEVWGSEAILRRLVTDGVDDFTHRQALSERCEGLLDKIISSFQGSYLQGVLERQDRMSMAASVEARVPFCSPPLYDLVNAIDHREKVRGRVAKLILKRLAERHFDPAFVYRRKRGFSLPLRDWLRSGQGIGVFLDLLTDRRFRERGFWDASLAARLVEEHRTGVRDWYRELMVLINFEMWHRIFVDRSIPADPPTPPGAAEQDAAALAGAR